MGIRILVALTGMLAAVTFAAMVVLVPRIVRLLDDISDSTYVIRCDVVALRRNVVALRRNFDAPLEDR